MPSDKEIEIILKLRDEVTKVLQGVQQNLHKFSTAVREVGVDMRKTGRELSSMGSSMAMAGTAITGPLIAAYKEAGKYNADISRQLNETKNVFQRLSVSIGESLIPVMRELTDDVAKMVSWWKNLDQATRDKIITNIFNLGKNLIILGAAFVIVGKSVAFLGNLAILTTTLMKVHPYVLAATAAFTILSVAMLKSKAIADGIIFAFTKITQIISGGLINIDYKKMSAGLDDFKKSFTDISSLYKDFLSEMGKGDWEKEKLEEGNFFSGFKMGLEQTRETLASWRDTGIQAAAQLANGMQSNIKTGFLDIFHNQLKTAKDYFKAFGDMILDIFADVCAKIVTEWITTMAITGLGKLFGAAFSFGGGITSLGTGVSQGAYGSGNFVDVARNTVATPYYHSGGLIRAHGGLNLASDEIPIIAQTGERVLSRSQNREYERGRGSGVVVNQRNTFHIQAVDAASFQELCMRNPEAIASIAKYTVLDDINRNGDIRKSRNQ